MQFARGHDILDPKAAAFYRRAIATLKESEVPFLVGGGYGFTHYTGIERHTKDFDVLVRPGDCQRALKALSGAGYQTDLPFPYWLGKAFSGDDLIDVIFRSSNGVAEVDDSWFEHARAGEVLGMTVALCPPEEVIWTKAFIMERERYDGADVAHLLRACAKDLDWSRLLGRFDRNWRVLLSHLILFGFIYPAERSQVPGWVMDQLLGRLQGARSAAPPGGRLCQGTLLSRAQYLVDLGQWGYKDARLVRGTMTPEEAEHWTAAIDREK